MGIGYTTCCQKITVILKFDELRMFDFQFNRSLVCVTTTMGIGYTTCGQKITVIFKFHELRMFDFRIFFSVMLLHMLTLSPILDCQFVFDR